MFRFLFRFLGLVLLTFGFLVLVHDGTKSIADQIVYITKVGPAWENIHQNSFKALEPVVEVRRDVDLEQHHPALFSQPTGCARLRHRRRSPDPPRTKEKASNRLCARLSILI